MLKLNDIYKIVWFDVVYLADCNLTSHFQCGNRMSCLPLTKRCDAVVDCWDATDELNCTIRKFESHKSGCGCTHFLTASLTGMADIIHTL